MSRVGKSLTHIAKGAGIVFCGTAIGNVLALVGQILIVRSLPPEQFGTLALAFTIVSSFGGVIVFGAPQGVTRLISSSEAQNEKVDVLRSGLLISFVAGLLGLVAIQLFRFRIERLTDTPGLSSLLSVFSIYVLIFPVASVLIGGLRGYKRPTARVTAKNLIARTGALLTLGALLLTGEPYAGTIAYWLSGPLLILFVSLYLLRSSVSFDVLLRRLPSASTVREFISFSWPLAFSASFVLLMSKLDVLMIGLFLQPHDVGLYRSVQPLKKIILFSLTSITFLYLPIATEYYTNGRYSDLDTIYKTLTKWVVTVTFPIVLVFVLFAPDIIRVLFTGSYVPASTALVILILGMFTRVLVGPNGTTVQAINKTQTEMYAACAGTLVNVLLNTTLIPRVGIEGAAFATAIGFLSYNVIEILVIYRSVGITPLSKNVVKPLAPTTVVALGIHFLKGGHRAGIFLIALAGILLGVVHLISLVGTKSIDDADETLVDAIDGQAGINLSRIYEKVN